ncbi:ATP synthase subunit I|uniref:ATP synthase I chain n=1 Tax=Dendrosporobacter quercicolus TaxID=146817 RepID=A0A1G9R2E6_9FIRM|nr:ATP synthase subunit I [Dendrosporobacter quercicolus]NSL48441.1 ATP synthase subunit I [Dendrosporobacter quercicolus DSM 1736]SDM17027.1 ATP synthase I chain [Dendrosporobacter quercicolus]
MGQDRQQELTEYRGEVKRTMLSMAIWGALAIAVLCLAGRQSLIPGFLLGLSASLGYYALLSFRVRQSAALQPEKIIAYMRAGWLIRLSFLVMVVIVVLKMPGIDFLAAMLGLFSFQIIMLAQNIIVVVKSLRT